MPSLEQWFDAWSRFSVEPNDTLRNTFDTLIARYSEPQRHYHTVRHLDDCLTAFREIRDQADNPQAVEIALWFHDAVYDTKATNNEQRSADLARTAILNGGLDSGDADRVHRLVMVTTHSTSPDGRDEQVIVDVDLSILGAGTARFDEYEHQVRQEYSWVPDVVYRHKRGEVLKRLLERNRIFHTKAFHDRLEGQARENIQRSLRALQV